MPYGGRTGRVYFPPTPVQLYFARIDYERHFLRADAAPSTFLPWGPQYWDMRGVLCREEHDPTRPPRTEATPEEYELAEVEATTSAVVATGRPWARLSLISEDRATRRQDVLLMAAYAFYIRRRLALLNEPRPPACAVCGMPTPSECVHCGSPFCEEERVAMEDCAICWNGISF